MSAGTFLFVTRSAMCVLLILVTIVFGLAGQSIIAAIIGFSILPFWAFSLGRALWIDANRSS